MPEAPRPDNEQARLRELWAYDVLDTTREPSFDRLTRLASNILGTPMALVSLVDETRQWFKSTVGFESTGSPRAQSFCAYAVHSQSLVEVTDASTDPRFHDNPLVIGAPHIRFYAGAPLTTPSGFVLGTICGFDVVPRAAGLSDQQRAQLADLAALVVDELELRRSVRLLSESQRELDVVRLATDAASDAIVITDPMPSDGGPGPRIVYVNEAFVTMTGYARGEALGRTLQMLEGPDTDPAALDRIREALRSGRPVREAVQQYRKDGTSYWVELRMSPVLGRDPRAPQLVAVQRDITEQRAYEQALVEREARYRLLFDRNPQCMWVYDADTGRFLDVNDAALAMYGYTRDEFLAMSIFDIRPAEDVEDVRAALRQRPLGGLGPAGEWRHHRKDGTLLHVRVQSHATEHSGRNARLALITNISAEHALEQQLRQSQKMEAVGALAGGLAHDFNNLLTVINGYAEIIASQLDPDDTTRHDLEQIRRAGQRATTLTQQLLAFSRGHVLHPEPVAPATLVAELEPMLARLLREDINLQLRIGDDLPFVLVDPTQLELVVVNLVVNAADAMPEGGDLTVACELVEVVEGDASVQEPGLYIVLSVRDTGVGMDEDTRRRAFEPFFTTKPKGRGTGLGLSTAVGIVTQSGGHLAVESEPGRGSTFRIYLPVAGADAPEPAPRPSTAAADLRGHETVLIVEDDGAVRAFAADVLEASGYQVLVAPDGPTALALADSRGGQVDLLLADLVMPRMGGRALADQLRRQHGVARVLFMSGYTEDAIGDHQSLRPGVELLAKPFAPQSLLHKVRQLLDQPAATPTVVVADDEAPLRRMLALTLTRAGYAVREARHGREAIERCREQPVDLLLTDLVMPEQEGLETIRELRRELPHVRIVAMSGAFDGKFLEVARAFGADAVLQKPFDGRTVLDTVIELVGRPAASGR